ncbi:MULTISPECIES: WD40 repeat domain-containing protein [Planktothricoides]|uniref:WD40 repeat domain-containing protein n=2 Tax=Planktothricoides raciborskii TaxID=132608 RepID=A0AAU8JBG2_9CYAN|nr:MULTISPECIES: WD40 repeat domain-containing protein [Planktothricoides]MBD2545434.1 WD40 repeat domain-containing protein [Planktothricoides raciborskii FACHB-1370]MBD2583662.1 WD40 repeat domain-containing protein [Planktothricoides raciborskii FACHB-1261]
MLNNRNWLESAEYVSLIGSVIGSIVAIFSGNAIYATVPLCFSLIFNTINRSRFEVGVRRNSISINRIQRQVKEELSLSLEQRSPSPGANAMPSSLGQKLLDQARRQKATATGENSTPSVQNDPQIQKQIEELKEQYANLLESINRVINYLNSNGLVGRVERLEQAIAERMIKSPSPMTSDSSRAAPATPSAAPATPSAAPATQTAKTGEHKPPDSNIPPPDQPQKSNETASKTRQQNNSPVLPKFLSPETTPMPQTWKYIQSLSGHLDWVKSIAISPASTQLVSGSLDSKIKLWNLVTGQIEATLDYHDRGVFAVAISPDGTTLASTSWDKTIKLWELPSGDLIDTLTGHSGSVRSAVFTHDSHTLISCSFDETIKLWDVRKGQLIKTLTDYSAAVYSLALHPNGKTLATGSSDGNIILWNLATNSEIAILSSSLDVVESLIITPNGRTLISGNGDGSIQLWQLNEAELLSDHPSVAVASLQNTLTVHTGEVTALAIAPDGESFASASADGTVKIWHLDTLQLLSSLPADSGAVMSLAISPDGKFLATGMAEGSIKIWQRA